MPRTYVSQPIIGIPRRNTPAAAASSVSAMLAQSGSQIVTTARSTWAKRSDWVRASSSLQWSVSWSDTVVSVPPIDRSNSHGRSPVLCRCRRVVLEPLASTLVVASTISCSGVEPSASRTW
jgi:hypothetical protein